MLHTGGLEKSAEATVKERAGRVKGAALEIKSIIEDFQMQCIGGMRAAWELWESTRMAFKVRCMMVPEIPNNFKDKYKKKENGLICSYCDEGQVMSQSHCLVCPAWAEQREGLDLTSIVDMASFFRKLLAERERLEALDV